MFWYTLQFPLFIFFLSIRLLFLSLIFQIPLLAVMCQEPMWAWHVRHCCKWRESWFSVDWTPDSPLGKKLENQLWGKWISLSIFIPLSASLSTLAEGYDYKTTILLFWVTLDLNLWSLSGKVLYSCLIKKSPDTSISWWISCLYIIYVYIYIIYTLYIDK